MLGTIDPRTTPALLIAVARGGERRSYGCLFFRTGVIAPDAN
jgi:L-fucose mutarotase/ribose pyranase (RbsD/FucU family)